MAYRGKPTPKQRPALPSSVDDSPTQVECPLCAGCGMVPPELAAAFADKCREIKEQA